MQLERYYHGFLFLCAQMQVLLCEIKHAYIELIEAKSVKSCKHPQIDCRVPSKTNGIYRKAV